MSKPVVSINGSFLFGRITGMERFAWEVIKELDDLCDNGQYEIIVPRKAKKVPNLNKIRIVRFGYLRGLLWTLIDFQLYILTHNSLALSLNSIVPIIRPGYVCIHDITFKVNKHLFNYSIRSKLSSKWRCFQYKLCFKFSPIIFTVSEFSKKEILKYYFINKERIVVLGNGWNHFEHLIPNPSLRYSHPEYFTKPFFFALGSIAENKNLKWVLETAKYHPSYNFLIAGGIINKYGIEFTDNTLANVFFLGYISDEEVKYLMTQAKAFLFPSIYEGFGIPPLEALSVGTDIIISNATCLPEIFGDCAHYINPYVPCENLEAVLDTNVNSPQKILKDFTWNRVAQKLNLSITTSF